MAFRDEIDRVIAEEEKKAQRTRTQTTRRATRNRFEKPTYLAYYAGKLLFFLQRFWKPKGRPVAPDTNTPPAGHDPNRKKRKKPTSFTGIMREDIRNFMKRFSGEPKKKKPLPGSGESFDDWKDAFEKDGQAGVKEEDENVYTGGGGL
jgi:hypothetical protein